MLITTSTSLNSEITARTWWSHPDFRNNRTPSWKYSQHAPLTLCQNSNSIHSHERQSKCNPIRDRTHPYITLYMQALAQHVIHIIQSFTDKVWGKSAVIQGQTQVPHDNQPLTALACMSLKDNNQIAGLTGWGWLTNTLQPCIGADMTYNMQPCCNIRTEWDRCLFLTPTGSHQWHNTNPAKGIQKTPLSQILQLPIFSPSATKQTQRLCLCPLLVASKGGSPALIKHKLSGLSVCLQRRLYFIARLHGHH